jgi:DNA modification methylase
VLDVTEAESDKLLLTLDPLAAMAVTGSEELASLLKSVSFENAGELEDLLGGLRSQAGIDGRDLIEVPAQIDKAAELQAKWGTARGQVWEIGPHRLVCGDCREKGALYRLWRDGGSKIRMVWTDPPYGVGYAAKNAVLNRINHPGNPGHRIEKEIEGDSGSSREVGQLFTDALLRSVLYAEPGAACYTLVPAGPMLPVFIAALDSSGFRFRWQLVWVKSQFVFGRSDYHFRHENVLYGWLENGAHLWAGDHSQDSIFEVDKPHVSDLHPTTKPVELIARMIANSSRPGELVYDPFCGSGSTLVAAHQLGRAGYGVEIDPGYVAVTLERLVALGLEPKLSPTG